jgi:uncharacterized protein with HEPN domain
MQLEAKKYLYDIQTAAEQTTEFTTGSQFADYERQPMMRLAVERAFSIIGEALAQLAKLDVSTAEQITGYRRIIAFRNIVVHVYDEVDARLVWDLIQGRLPLLRQQVAALLRAANEGEA